MTHHITYRLQVILVCLAVSLMAKAQGGLQTISGHVSGSPSPFALLYCNEGTDTMAIATDGSLSFTKTVTTPQYGSVGIPKTQVYLGIWLQGGKSAVLDIDAQNPKQSSVSGEVKAETDFFNALLMSVLKWSSPASAFPVYQHDWTAYQDSLVSASAQLHSNEFTAYLKDYLTLQGVRKQMYFFETLGKHGLRPDADAEYNAFMNAFDRNSDASQKSELVFVYLCWRAACMTGSYAKDYVSMMKALRDDISNQTTRDIMGFRLMRMYFTSDNATDLKGAYDIAHSIVSTDVQPKVDTFYNNYNRPKDSMVPNLQLLSVDGKTVNLADICDADVTYIDIWSTSCVPCIKQIPYVAKLQEKYASDKRIKFVSFSLDRNLDTWKKFLNKQSQEAAKTGTPHDWPQYVVPVDKQRQFLDAFAINGIPRFLILGRGGRVIDMNASRPSDPKAEQQILSALK